MLTFWRKVRVGDLVVRTEVGQTGTKEDEAYS